MDGGVVSDAGLKCLTTFVLDVDYNPIMWQTSETKVNCLLKNPILIYLEF